MPFIIAQAFTGLASASILFLVAAGLSIVFGVTRIVNFSHGGFVMIGAYIGYALIDRYGTTPAGFWACVLAASAATAFCGAAFEITVLRRLYRAPELFQLLGTFAAALIIQDVLLKTFGGEDLLGPRAPGLATSAHAGGIAFPLFDIVVILIAPTVLALTWLLLHKTRWGLLVRAATQDREMVGALGTDQSWLFTGVFALGSFLAGFAGALQVPRDAINLDMGIHFVSDAFAVVVIGGMASLPGAFVASLLIGEMQAFGVAWFPQLTLVLTFLVMALTLVIRPHGLFGRPDALNKPHEFSSEPPLRATSGRAVVAAALVVLGLTLLPAFAGAYTLGLLSETMIGVIFAASLYFLMGPAGLISFGHACYFGLGAYAAALAVHDWHVAILTALAVAVLAGGVGAMLFGWLCRRVSGVYFAMLTLAFGQIVWSISFQWYAVTGGDNGIVGIRSDTFSGNPRAFYYLVLGLGLAALLLIRHVIHAPFGYTLRTARDSVLRAEAIGIAVGRHRWYAFILSGTIAGLAGGLFAFQKGSVFPGYLDVTRSLDGTVMVLLGGVHALLGSVVGAAAFFGLQTEIMRYTDLWRAALGGTIILIVLLTPNGLIGLLRDRRKDPG